MIKTINEAIDKLYTEFCLNSFGNEVIYNMCINSDYPWGDTYRLAEKMRLIGKHSDSIPIRHISNHFFVEVAKSLTGSNLQINGSYEKLQFNGSGEDLQNLKNFVFCVFKFEEAIEDAVRKSGYAEDEKMPPYTAFCSTFLHYHYPQCFFAFDRKNYAQSKFVFSEWKCKLSSVAVPEEIKLDLVEKYDFVFGFLKGELPSEKNHKKPTQAMYLAYCARAYVLGCFLKESCNINKNITAFISELFRKIDSGIKIEVKNFSFTVTHRTSVDELYDYCKDVDDFNLLFGEYIKLKNAYKREQNIARLILENFEDEDKGNAFKIAHMALNYEKYALKDGKSYSIKDGKIILKEFALSRVKEEFSYNGKDLRKYIKFCIKKLALN